jgi:dihydrofolate reductase
VITLALLSTPATAQNNYMRKIITTTFVTMDGVMQAPGGPGEDTSGGFKYGGWQLGGNYGDEVAGKVLNDFMATPFELLLGKHTYQIFASYWPTDKVAPHIAKPFNSTKKYVVAHKPFELSWNNSMLITGDVVSEIRKLKNTNAPDLWVHGSGNLIQTLLSHNLIDRMHIWTFPLTIGIGKKLFAEGTQPVRFKSVDTKITSTGVIITTCEPAGRL